MDAEAILLGERDLGRAASRSRASRFALELAFAETFELAREPTFAEALEPVALEQPLGRGGGISCELGCRPMIDPRLQRPRAGALEVE